MRSRVSRGKRLVGVGCGYGCGSDCGWGDVTSKREVEWVGSLHSTHTLPTPTAAGGGRHARGPRAGAQHRLHRRRAQRVGGALRLLQLQGEMCVWLGLCG